MADFSRPNRVLRKRIREVDSDDEVTPAKKGEEASDSERPSVSEIIRMRKQAQKRKYGLAFSNSTQSRRDDASEDHSEQASGAANPLLSVYSKFTAQTGVRVDTKDKQLEEYIDAQMSKMHSSQSKTIQNSQTVSTAAAQAASEPGKQKELERHFAPQEVDLGRLPSTNSEQPRTVRNLAVGAQVTQADILPPNDPHVRIGRDGKPYIPRRFRNRRTSADIERDKAVEDVLHENRTETFAMAPEEEDWGEGEDADERMAERFRREYLNEFDAAAAAKRDRERDQARNRDKKKEKVEEVLRGPKLGGSRSVRQRFIEEQLAKKG